MASRDLAAALPADVVRCGHCAIGFEEVGGIARVRFANGASAEADVRRRRRRHPCVFPPKPVFHGTVAYLGLVGRERPPDWPMDRWQMWAGPSKHFLVFPVCRG